MWIAPPVAFAQSAATAATPASSLTERATASTPLDPEYVAERDALASDREVMWGLFASGGILLTGGGFGTLGYAFPGNGLATILACGSGALVGLVLLFVAFDLDTRVHRRTDALRARWPQLAAGPGDLGLGVRLRY